MRCWYAINRVRIHIMVMVNKFMLVRVNKVMIVGSAETGSRGRRVGSRRAGGRGGRR